ncbi:MAG TPA: hypothetical protein VMS08_02980 [Candidatus Saccharimonadia bacterium]|nr:hypothetical protein [Candidatus Saccharimonadia bacterium]
MSAINFALLYKSRRRERLYENFALAVNDVCVPFTLESLYPERDIEISPGKYVTVQGPMPHQIKAHEGITPSGKKAKYIMLSGGVGNGKSINFAVDIVAHLRRYPGIQIVLCADGDTLVEGVPIGDCVQPEYVRTALGQSPASAPFRRGQADLWRVQLQSGKQISVTDGHRFLTPAGWRSLKLLSVGDVIATDGNLCENSGLETPTSLTDRYSEYSHLGDELLLPEAVFALHTLRLLLSFCGDCERRRRLSSVRELHLAGRPPFCPEVHGPLLLDFHARNSTKRRNSYQSSRSSRPTDTGSQPPLSEVLAGLSSLPLALYRIGREVFELLGSGVFHEFEQQPYYPLVVCNPRTPAADRIVREALTCLAETHSYEGLRKLSKSLRLAAMQPSAESPLLGKLAEFLQTLASLYPPHNYNTCKWDRITNIEYNKYGDYFDLSVLIGNNYFGNGVLSHNCAPYSYMIDEFFLPTLRTVLPDESPLIKQIKAKEGRYIMRNGAELRMKAYEDASRIRGWQCHRIYITEAAEIGDGNPYKAAEIFKALGERLRGSGDYPLGVCMDQNPRGHNWSWKIFVKPNKLGDVGLETVCPPDGYRLNEIRFREYEHTDAVSGDTYYTIAAGTSANPYLPKGYLDSMLAHRRDDPMMKARMIDGSFTPINALVYELPYYSKQSHIIDVYRFLQYWELDAYDAITNTPYDDPRDAIPRTWPLYLGIDSAGASSPWAVEFYVETPEDDFGQHHYICIDEMYFAAKGMTWAGISMEIRRRTTGLTDQEEKDYPSRVTGGINPGWQFVQYWIDPYHSKQQSGPNQEAIYDEFQRNGIPVQAPRGYNQAASVARVKEYLHRDRTLPCPYIDDFVDDDPELPEEERALYEIGCARLYYLGHRDGANPDDALLAYAKANIAEKQEYRMDNKKQRQASEAEEGLTPMGPEKIIDRDDHAQTAEMFAFLGINPLPRTRQSNGKRVIVDEDRSIYPGRRGR